MAEIRCPMCGKDNPDHLDVCKFCQARLKPLGSIPSDLPSIFPEDLESDDELPDWMEFDADFDDSEDSTPFDDSGDDWLSRIEGKSEEQSDLMAESRAAARMDFNNNGIPDWMEDLEKDRTTPPFEPSQEPVGSKTPDFLMSDQESDTPEEADETDLMDWFLEGSDEKDESAASAAQVGLPNWLVSSDESETDEPEGIASFEAEIPNFFSDSDKGDQGPILPIAQSELPESSPEYVAQETIPLADFEGDLPDWLADAGNDETEILETQNKSSASKNDQDSDLPAWLFDGEKEGEDEAEPALTPEGDVPDWLSDLDGAGLAPEETAAPAEESGTALPDWLADFGGQEDTPVSASPKEPEASRPFDMDTGDLVNMLAADGVESESLEPASESELPDWLSGAQEPESAQPVAESDLPPWLSDLSGSEEEPPEEPKAPKPFDMETGDLESMLAGAAAESESLEPASESELSDALSEMSASEDAESAEPSEAPKPFDMDTGVLAGMLAADVAARDDLEPVSESELPDWLSDLSAQEEAEEIESPKSPKPFDMDTGDLASMLSEGAEDVEGGVLASDDEMIPEAEPAVDEELPDWLAGDIDEPKTAISATEGDLPDWLSGDDEAEAVEPEVEGDMPDWLSDLDSGEIKEPAEIFPEQTAASEMEAEEADLPDWLSDMGGDETPPEPGIIPEQVVGPPLGAEEGETLPDWLSGLDEEQVDEDDEALPDWLKDSVAGAAGAVALDAAAEAMGSDEPETPEWLSNLDGTEEPTDLGESRAVPDWLQDAEPSIIDEAPVGLEPTADAVEEAAFSPGDSLDDDLFEFDQLSDWISEENLAGEDQPQEITSSVDDLSPAELPGWLAAMRPVESSASTEAGEVDRGPMENSGPLAGLYSVLAAEPEVSRLKKPPVYSSRLQITDAQQTHANLLQELLETEGKSQPLPLPPLISSQRIFRLVLSIILVVIAFLAVIAGGGLAVMPQAGNIPPGVFETSEIVNPLNSNDSVLIAFDYEPGLSGEMDAASSAVVDSIMLKGAKLALVSTSSAGPALAERYINKIQGQHGYQSGSQYVNLGYVPGGVAGLAAFAHNPRWVSPNTLEGLSAWEMEPLTNIGRVSDFALVVVITENPNTIRAWVEQVNPQLGSTPLIAIVSAQVEPMARPYFNIQEGQIDGLISGLTGGAAYEVVNRPNLAHSYWDAFNILLIVAVSAILIGGAINIVSTLMAQRKESGEEAK